MPATFLTITLNPVIDISAVTDVVRPIHKTRVREERYDPGGGGINVARVLTKLGGEVDALCLTGGATGVLLNELLEAHSLRHHKIGISGNTRISFNIFEKHTGLEYRFLPDGPVVGDAEIAAVLDYVTAHPADYVIASGSAPNGSPKDIFVQLSELVHRQGGRFVLDSSGEALSTTLKQGRCYLVKPSLSELEFLAGHELDEIGARNTAQKIVADGHAEIVAVTLGGRGGILAHEGGIVRAPAHHVPIRSAVGAGDSFVAGMVWALGQGWDREKAFRFAMAAGAAAVLTPGTELCRVPDIYRIFEAG
ncbi:MAG: 1-phosphofructokinase family hexose kinase [Hyphomicrobiaceae bacterium]|nr:1-phosphofructokinase family hexose kinase [Hyphomicrobiaceae bacterium]